VQPVVGAFRDLILIGELAQLQLFQPALLLWITTHACHVLQSAAFTSPD
jgi:hypothetical protein